MLCNKAAHSWERLVKKPVFRPVKDRIKYFSQGEGCILLSWVVGLKLNDAKPINPKPGGQTHADRIVRFASTFAFNASASALPFMRFASDCPNTVYKLSKLQD